MPRATPLRRVLVPMDFEPGCLETFREAMNLARACRAEVHLVHALGTRRGAPSREWVLDRFHDVLAANGDLVSTEFFVRAGDSASVVEEAADMLGADLVVLRAPHDAWGFSAPWGSLVEALQRKGTAPLCLVPWPGSGGSRSERDANRDERACTRFAQVLGVAALVAGGAIAWSVGSAPLSIGVALLLGTASAAGWALARGLWRRTQEEAATHPPDWTESPAEGSPAVLVPVPASGPSDALMGLLKVLVASLGVRVMLLHVLDPAAGWSAAGSAPQAFESLRLALGGADCQGALSGFSLRVGDCLEEIVAAAIDWGVHAIVVDSAGGEGLSPVVIRRLLPRSPCPVWLTPGGSGGANGLPPVRAPRHIPGMEG